jgi:autophagy-related protein 9
MFFTSAIMVPILALTVYDDSILSIEHMITILSGLSLLFLICRLVKLFVFYDRYYF